MGRGLNKVMVIGYLGRDPEMRFTPKGRSVSSFSVGCSHSWKSAEGEKKTETEWFNVVAWGNLAEKSKQLLKKGSLVYVEGRLQSRSWQDTEGVRHNAVEIVARDILLLNENENQQNNINNSEDNEEYSF